MILSVLLWVTTPVPPPFQVPVVMHTSGHLGTRALYLEHSFLVLNTNRQTCKYHLRKLVSVTYCLKKPILFSNRKIHILLHVLLKTLHG